MKDNLEKKTLTYLDENDFNKQLRAIRTYFMNVYKYLTFDFFKKGIFEQEIGVHWLYLPTDRLFEKVYGKLMMQYEVTDRVIILIRFEPRDILIAGYISELNTYKGVFYRDEKDKKKIEIIKRLKEVNAGR